MDNLKLLIKISRPIGWVFIPIVILGGYLYRDTSLSPMLITQALYFSFPFSLFLYGINDVNDYKSDLINPSKGGIFGAKFKKSKIPFIIKWVKITAVGTILISLLTLNWINIFASALMVILGYYYSVDPIRLKTKPPIDSFSNAFLYVLVPFLIGSSYYTKSIYFPREILFAALVLTGMHALVSIRDYKYDKKAGDATFSTKYGKKTSAIFSTATALVAIIFGDIDSIFLRILLYSILALSIFATIKPSESNLVRMGKLIPYVFYSTIALYIVSKLLQHV